MSKEVLCKREMLDLIVILLSSRGKFVSVSSAFDTLEGRKRLNRKNTKCRQTRDGSRTAATSKMECIAIIVNGFQRSR